MRLGIFAKTYPRSTLEEVLDAIGAHEIQDVHFNYACVGLEPLPAEITSPLCRTIRTAFGERGLSMSSVSGTYNVIHPDRALRAKLTQRACRLIQYCPELGTSVVTLCSGTRCADDMWTAHSDNAQPDAWDDLRRTLEELLEAARHAGVVLCIEPEHANVIFTANRARRLLDEFASSHLKIVIDAANLLNRETLAESDVMLEQAFRFLGPDIIMAHAKDLPREPHGSHAAGCGLVPWEAYVTHLAQCGCAGPLVLHGLKECEIPASVRFLKALLAPHASKADARQKSGAQG